jgi:4-amino-4-deoxy-L-arabinose transferase-like glycosyltransferase
VFRRPPALPLLGLTLFAFAVRLYRLGDQGLWFDETVSVVVARMGWLEGYRFLVADGVHPPLYYVIQKLVLPLGSSEMALRIPAAVFGALTVPLVYLLARDSVSPAAGWTAALLFCLSPFHLWYSREARMYSLLVLVSVASLYAHLRWLEVPSRPRALASGVAHTVAYLTHYFGAMLFLIEFAHLLLRLRAYAPRLRGWVFLQGLASLPLLVWLAQLAQREGNFFGIGWIPAARATDPLLTLVNFTLGVRDPLQPAAVAATAVAFTLVVAAFLHHRWTPGHRTLYALWVFLPLGLGLLFSLRRPLYVDRFFLASLPAWWILIGAGFSRLPSRAHIGATLAAALVLMWASTGFLFDPDQRKEQWREAARYLADQAAPGEVVVPRVLQIVVPLQYYGPMSVPLEPLESNRQITPLGEIARAASGTWLVYWNAAADAHRVANNPAFDPEAETDPEALAWLRGDGPARLTKRDFVGVTLLHFGPTVGQTGNPP